MQHRRRFAAVLLAVALVFTMGCEELDEFLATPTPDVTSGDPAPTIAAPTTSTPSPAVGAPACAPPYPSGPPTATTVFCADPTAMERGVVTHIVDGDTIDVIVDGREERIRVFGVDTTERGEPCFREATERMRALAGSEVRLQPATRERDRYDRLLRYVYTPEGRSIDAQLVAEGLGRAWRDDGDLRFALIELELAAQENGVGCLWSGL